MNSKNLSLLNNKLDSIIKEEEVIDIVVFGSTEKGKPIYHDIDLAIILYNKASEKLMKKINKLKEFHISLITAKEFFINPPLLVTTLLREGYSLKNKKSLAESFRFLNRVLFKYDLINLSKSSKVKIVNILHGIKGEKGLVESNEGQWVANQVFFAPVTKDKLFEEFFKRAKIKFQKSYVLMH